MPKYCNPIAVWERMVHDAVSFVTCWEIAVVPVPLHSARLLALGSPSSQSLK